MAWLPCLLLLLGCGSGRKYDKRNATVYIEKKDGHYQLIRNGQPYFIKGACGNDYIKKLVECGGNTIRVYDTANLGATLNEAGENNVAVMAGIYMPPSREQNLYYEYPEWNKKNLAAIREVVLKYKNHPALLMWCVGNELDFPFGSESDKFYTGFNEVVDMIHELDPNHPVTTTVIDLHRRNVLNITRKTRVDIISFNVFYGVLKTFAKRVSDFSIVWDGPYLISEWGIDGPWGETRKTSWMAPYEPTSAEKANILAISHQQYIPYHDGRLLGSFIFFWGYKQESTHTWFSFFTKDGNTSEMVAEMKHIWTGKYPVPHAPQIDMQIDNYPFREDIIYKPGDRFEAKATIKGADSCRLEWNVYPEDWVKKGNFVNSEKFIDPVYSALVMATGTKAVFQAPAREGPYRLFLTAFDNNGNYATCNLPFYVVNNN